MQHSGLSYSQNLPVSSRTRPSSEPRERPFAAPFGSSGQPDGGPPLTLRNRAQGASRLQTQTLSALVEGGSDIHRRWPEPLFGRIPGTSVLWRTFWYGSLW